MKHQVTADWINSFGEYDEPSCFITGADLDDLDESRRQYLEECARTGRKPVEPLENPGGMAQLVREARAARDARRAREKELSR